MINLGKQTNSTNSKKKNDSLPPEKVYVLDASAIYNGILARNLDGRKFIPECVVAEVEGMFRGEALIAEGYSQKDVFTMLPTDASFKRVNVSAKETGDIQELSECDCSVLAIALDLLEQDFTVEILSDDYDIQNLASFMSIPYSGVAWKGITRVYRYYWVCPACGMKSKQKMKRCIECGTPMKRKSRK
ncbi:MAG: hypothetical protein GF308_13785 [Candidatus Heimdallarchaeota archaeon]|nr:hypothetical protein [Candidatus Heimdallarchaeota archaeon]